MAKKVRSDFDTLSFIWGTICGLSLPLALGPVLGGVLGFFLAAYVAGRFENRIDKGDVFKGFAGGYLFLWVIVLTGS